MKKTLTIIDSCSFLITFIPILFFFFFFFYVTTCDSLNTTSDKILLNCGSSSSSPFNGVNWIGDNIATNFLPPSYNTISSTLLNTNSIKAPKIPYSTARIIHSPFTYSFTFSPGLKFIRIYFLSTQYLMNNINPSKSIFSVKSGPYTLLSNFNPSLNAEELNLVYITKDFIVNTREEKLNITFTPSTLVSNSFAFVNGIEIFSVPSSIYPHEYALEMLYRVNIGSQNVEGENAFGKWVDDVSYLSGLQHGSLINIRDRPVSINYTTLTSKDYNFSAPEEIYFTARSMGNRGDANMGYNLTWAFPVDSGFKYLVRLHFCEISMEVTQVNQRVFTVYINSQTVEESLDLIALAGKQFTPLHRDYVVNVPMESIERRGTLWIALHPNLKSKPKYADAILNGVEIIKLSDSNSSLAASFQLKREQKAKKFSRRVIIVTASTLGSGTLLGLFIAFFVLIRRRKRKNFQVVTLSSANKNSCQVTVTSDHCYQFSLDEIRIATNNFSEALVIGEGGFGKVYKGIMPDGMTHVAIKRAKPSSRQGFKEFQNEINFFSFCHMNLVSLLGYCQESNELILVYEYISQGTLCDHLYKKVEKERLSWNQRLEICVGVARGLHYLHTGTGNAVIHRDIKSANILLDQNLVPKIADFGLSRIVPSTYHTHVSTEVKGTFGYLDPEYYKRRKLTEKSDVYSFGVVLFEVLCGRPAVNPMDMEEESEKVGLAQWAMHCYNSGNIDLLVDKYLEGRIRRECLKEFVDIGIQCLSNKRAARPTMGELVNNLEKILSLQESVEEEEINRIHT